MLWDLGCLVAITYWSLKEILISIALPFKVILNHVVPIFFIVVFYKLGNFAYGQQAI